MANKVLFEIVATAKGVNIVQKQTDKLAKSTDKARKSTDGLSKSRDNYNRKEKGAAGISSNSTKNFSKMQQGIDGGGGSGGLVRAYALLAANVFALTAAFGVLSRSAQIDTLTQSMEILSTTGGTYIKSLAKDMQQASGGAIDLAQSFRQVSLASSAGLNTSEIEGLTQVAKGAAISLGRDLPDAMDRIFRGAIKLEPEILDEIGLFVRVDEAAQKYADTHNKVASSLSQAEKRQGFLNEILEQGKNKFQEYAETVKPDPYVRLGAALGDIAQGGLSLLNGVLGPVLEFLAESKGALTVVFGVLVFSLLKKAIPAMGQFNAGLAEQAKKAADNAKKYSDGVTESTKHQIKEDKKKLDSSLKTLQKQSQGSPMLKLKVGGKDASGKIEADLQNKAIKGKKRQAVVEQRILDLTKKQGLAKRSQMPGYKEELAALQKEKQINQEILDLKNQKAVVQDPNQLSGRRQSKLEGKSNRLAIVSSATNVGENEGMAAGFMKMNKDLKKNEKGLGMFAKGATRAQGSISLLGGGISKLMMSLGPFMMLFSMLAPLAMMLAKHLGIGSEEAKKFDNSLKSFSEMQEKITKRFDKQTEAMNDSTLSMLEQSKATLAYNNAQAGTMQTLTKMQNELKDFQFEMTNTASGWENFKSKIGMGREEKLLKAQADAIGKSIRAAIQAGDEVSMTAFEGMDNDTVDATIEAAKAAVASDTAIANSKEKLGKVNNETNKNMRRAAIAQAENAERGFSLNNKYKASTREYNDATEGMTEGQIAHIAVMAAGIKITKDAEGVNKNLTISLDEGVAVTKTIGDEQAIAAKKQQAFADANKSATSTFGKFASSFNIKTKVDGVISSFDDLNMALKDLGTEKTEKFFAEFDAADNAFKQMFTKDEIADIEKNGRKLFDTVVDKLKDYQDNIIKSKTELASLAKMQKLSAKFSGLYNKELQTEQKSVTRTAELKATVAKNEFDTVRRTKKLEGLRLDAGKAILASSADYTLQEEMLNQLGVKRADVQAVIAAEIKSQDASAASLLATNTEDERIGIGRVKAEQKVLETAKALLATSSKQLRVSAQIAQLSKTGSSKLDATSSAKLTMDAANQKYKLEMESAGLKKELLDYEMEILRLQLDSLIAQKGKDSDVFKNNKRATVDDEGNQTSEATGMFKTINKANESGTKLITDNLGLLKDQTTLAIMQSVESGFSEGAVTGIQTARAAMRAYKDSLKADEEGDPDVIAGIRIAALKGSANSLAEDMKKLGPEGEAAAAVVQGALAISDAFSVMSDVFSASGDNAATFGEKVAAGAEFAAAALGQISAMMAANSKAQVSEIDKQIEAEKKRDGKSSQSIAKIASMEKKKEAMKKKAFEQDKKMKMAQTVASTAAGMIGVFAGVQDPFFSMSAAIAQAAVIGVMGAASLAMIAKTSYQGGGTGIEAPPKQSLSIGKRDNKVDVSRGGTGGELAYMRGARGTGNANNFTPGGAMGRKGYAAGGEGILVGERGPEVVMPSQKVDVIPNDRLNARERYDVNFNINAVDAAGVEDLLINQRGNIIRMIREAANNTGERFLESVDTQTYGGG